jgi:hypothetical protein
MKLFSSLLALVVLVSATPANLLESRRGGDSSRGSCKNKCAQTTQGNFQWKITGLDYHASYVFSTPSHQNSWGYINFNLTNPAVGITVPCSASSNRLSDFFYGDQWYRCAVPSGVSNVPYVAFRYFVQSWIEVNQTWTCNDKKSGAT